MLNSKMVKVTLRDIAKMLVKYMPIEGQDFTSKIEAYISLLKKLDKPSKLALTAAYIFSSKCPKAEREDLFQELVTRCYEANPQSEINAYSVARCDWKNWLDSWYREHKTTLQSYDITIQDDGGNEIRASELLVGDCEFEARECSNIDASNIWQLLPVDIKPLVQKRLSGLGLSAKEGMRLMRFSRSDIGQNLINC
jgi:hypothetical protein